MGTETTRGLRYASVVAEQKSTGLLATHTDVLKTHLSQSVSSKLLEFKGIGSKHMPQSHLKKRTSFFPLLLSTLAVKISRLPHRQFFHRTPRMAVSWSHPLTLLLSMYAGEWFFVLSSLIEKKFVLNAGEKLMQPKTSQKFKNVACFRLLFKIKQPKRLQSTKSVAINTWFLLIKPNFNVKMQRYETNHRKRVVEENSNQSWSNKFLLKTYNPSFWGCHKSTENFVTHGFWARRYVALVVSVPIPLRTQ